MTEEVLFSKKGQLGVITLNRARALNALTLTMIHAMQQQLSAWTYDDSIKAVVIRAVPGTAFCAGGDVRWLYQSGKAGDPEQMQFFWHEYRLNHFIHHLRKPYIALMDGITMGGGVGVSLHGRYPIASERFMFAMPETSIGFFPDIGASYLLNHCPESLGVYLGLTGHRLNAQEALDAGLVYSQVSSEQMTHLFTELTVLDLTEQPHKKIEACIEQHATISNPASPNPLIDKCFSHRTMDAILKSLSIGQDEWSIKTHKSLMQKCPLSLKVTLAQLNKAQGMTQADCLKMDYTLVTHFMQGTEFYEGVRALLVDKDKNPQWSPASLDLVSDELVVSYFENTGSELEF